MEQLERSWNIDKSEQIEHKLYDTREASEILGVSIQKLRRAIKNLSITPVYLNNILRIPSSEIEKFFKKEEFTDVKNAAILLNVCEDTIRSLIKIGEIKAVRMSKFGAFRIHRNEIEKFTHR